VEKLLGHPKTGSIDPPENLATPILTNPKKFMDNPETNDYNYEFV